MSGPAAWLLHSTPVLPKEARSTSLNLSELRVKRETMPYLGSLPECLPCSDGIVAVKMLCPSRATVLNWGDFAHPPTPPQGTFGNV